MAPATRCRAGFRGGFLNRTQRRLAGLLLLAALPPAVATLSGAPALPPGVRSLPAALAPAVATLSGAPARVPGARSLPAAFAPAVATAQRPVHVDPLLLEQYVGQYRLSANFVLTILVENDRLYVRAPNRGIRLLVPTSETEFLEVESGLRITFRIRADTRRVDHLVFEQEGYGRRADRISAEVGLDPAVRPALALPEATLERYVGRYEEQPGFAIDVTREGGRLLARMTDQEAVAIFAESDTDFFYRDRDARISFRVESGAVRALVWRQGGAALEMRRMD